MAQRGGKREGSGRPAGSKGILGADVKTAILEAFNHEDVGGVKYLVTMAQEDRKTFAALLAKVIPAEIKAEIIVSPVQGILADIWGLEKPAEDRETKH